MVEANEDSAKVPEVQAKTSDSGAVKKYKIGGKTSGSWKKGESGNPKGRPKDVHRISYWLKKMLADSGGEKAESIAKNLLKKAASADDPKALEAAKLLLERIEGNVPQKIEVQKVEEVNDDDLAEALAG